MLFFFFFFFLWLLFFVFLFFFSNFHTNVPQEAEGNNPSPSIEGDGRVVRLCLENFQCRGVLLVRIIVGQGPTVLAVGADGGSLDVFPSPVISLLFSSLAEMAQY